MFRLGGLARDSRFHADEALFASFARQMVIESDWHLDQVAVDKPPTTFLLVGTSLSIWGQSEFGARLPNAFASLIELAAFYAFVKRITRRESVANTALLLLALNPLDIAYAPTVFQDPPMLACLLLGAWLAAGRNWGGTGLALGLMVIMKPTGLWMVPLVVGIGLLSRYTLAKASVRWWRSAIFFLLGMSLPIWIVVRWDQQRRAQSFIELGRHNNNPGRFIRADEVGPRAEKWLELLAAYTAYQWLAIVFLLIAVAWLVVSAHRRASTGLVSWMIAGFLVWYLGIYWLVAFNTWDRYVLPIAPFALMVVAQGAVWLLSRWQLVVAAMLLIVLSWGAAQQAFDRVDSPDVQGIDVLADTLNEQFAGQIVYDYWLGWHFRWYLGDDPKVSIVFFPTPEDLAIHLQDADGLRYFAGLSAEAAYPWRAYLEAYGVDSTLIYQPPDSDLVLYRLYPPNHRVVPDTLLPHFEVE